MLSVDSFFADPVVTAERTLLFSSHHTIIRLTTVRVSTIVEGVQTDTAVVD